MSKIRTHYDNLKVTRNAPDIVIKAAHKALLQMYHPDKASDKVAAERITRILNEARDVLLDPIRRKQHDDWIREKEHHHHPHHHDHASVHRHSNQSRQHEAETAKEQPIGRYIASVSGTATDTGTGLIWCRFALGQAWHNGKVREPAKTYTWQDALDAATAFNQHGGYAGYTDWRLPSINELKTLIDKQAGDKTAGSLFIDSRVFPDNPLWLWSSTPYAGYGGGAWFVHFREGEAINEDAGVARAVRLVRG